MNDSLVLSTYESLHKPQQGYFRQSDLGKVQQYFGGDWSSRNPIRHNASWEQIREAHTAQDKAPAQEVPQPTAPQANATAVDSKQVPAWIQAMVKDVPGISDQAQAQTPIFVSAQVASTQGQNIATPRSRKKDRKRYQDEIEELENAVVLFVYHSILGY